MSDIQAKLRIGDGTVEGFSQFTLKPGYTTDANTPYEIQNTPTTQLTGQNQLATFHDNDDGPPEIINLEENNRVWAFTLKIDAGSKAANLTALSTLKRHISGKQSTAYQAYRNGSQDFVWFDIRLDDESLWTSYKIMRGVVDDGQSFYTTAADKNRKALSCLVNLTCVPAGRGETITLRNDLPSSPHFIEDSNGDGLADGWNPQGVATLALSTTEYLIGGQSQQVTATTGNRGVTSYEFPTNGNTKVFTYAWIYVVSGNVVFTLYDNTAGVTVRSVAVSVANSDRQAKSLTGNTWLRIPILETGLNAANNFRLLVASSGGAAVFYVDGAYVQFGDISTAPDGWCSSSSLKNRYDPTSTSAATQQQINYLDVWGIPGDLPAIAKTSATPTTGLSSLYNIFKFSSGSVIASDVPYWQDSVDFDTGSSTWTAGTGTTDNHYFRLETTTPSGFLSRAIDWKSFTMRPARLYAAIRSSTTDATVSFQINSLSTFNITPATTFFQSDIVSVDVANSWELHDFGVINLTGITEPGVSKNLYLDLSAINSGSNTFDFDFAILAPVGEDNSYLIAKTNIGLPAATNVPGILIDGEEKTVRRNEDRLKQPFSGGFWSIKPEIMTRCVFMETGQNSATTYTALDIDTDPTVSLEITPQASHLLGG